jgi:IS5 family transposase
MQATGRDPHEGSRSLSSGYRSDEQREHSSARGKRERLHLRRGEGE